MKKNTKELEVDFIGGQGSLMALEEKALSILFLKRNKKNVQKLRQNDGRNPLSLT